jgi:hypothetical protein
MATGWRFFIFCFVLNKLKKVIDDDVKLLMMSNFNNTKKQIDPAQIPHTNIVGWNRRGLEKGGGMKLTNLSYLT